MIKPLVPACVLACSALAPALGQTCDTELLSRTPWGSSGDRQSSAVDISDDGRFVVLNTQARDLFDWSIDGNSFTSFLAGYDRLTGNIFPFEGNIFYHSGGNVLVDPISARISVNNAVVFDTLRDYTGNIYRGAWVYGNRVPDDNGFSDVYVRSLDIGGVSRVSVGFLGDDANGPSSSPDIDRWGWNVVFHSDASNLVAGDTNGMTDVFLSIAGYPAYPPMLISAGAGGTPADGPSVNPVIAPYGSAIAFASGATNLVPGDTNGTSDIFVTDWSIWPAFERVSVATGGVQADGPSTVCSLTADGDIVCFSSFASNLVPDDTNGVRDVFVHYRRYGFTERVSVSTAGAEGDAGSFNPGISASGRYVIFSSNAGNLVPDDTNGVTDAFAHDLWTGETARVSLTRSGGQLSGRAVGMHSDETGREVVFTSSAPNSGWDDSNGAGDAFLRDRGCDIEPYCVADFNFDHSVDTRDFIAFLNAWVDGVPRSDVDKNYEIDTRDFIAFLNAWVAGCP